ncbi:hypothetical protein FUAX_43630 (plasmid) [Fulvitalea axinellae]|uniref:Lin1244/Lin1753-like N-terminal domain-containing protein n=1 Tax=Fulvitalea axinellae TaxID=1182444 RepID=A0AAU9CII4_9BACT|nr:hypothetical protein FUAX_43630 [Fulvitalea axinellae]
MNKLNSYFSHDSSARNDQKIMLMLSAYGAQGYGWYWMLVEMMREERDYRLCRKGRFFFNALAHELRADAKTLEAFVDDCVNEFGLFRAEGDYFWSDSLVARMAMAEERTARKKKAAAARWEKRGTAAKEKPSEAKPKTTSACKSDATHMHCNAMKGNKSKAKETKEKEKKENKSKGNESGSGDNAPAPEGDENLTILPFSDEGFAGLWEEWKTHLRTAGCGYPDVGRENRALARLRPYDQAFATALVETALLKGWKDFHFEETPARWQKLQQLQEQQTLTNHGQISQSPNRTPFRGEQRGHFGPEDVQELFDRIDSRYSDS